MGLTDGLKALLEKAAELHRAYSVVSSKLDGLERQFDRLLTSNERFVERVVNENEELRRRVTTLEGIIRSAVVQAELARVARESVASQPAPPMLPQATRRSKRSQAVAKPPG
jgi:hypothetical protein